VDVDPEHDEGMLQEEYLEQHQLSRDQIKCKTRIVDVPLSSETLFDILTKRSAARCSAWVSDILGFRHHIVRMES